MLFDAISLPLFDTLAYFAIDDAMPPKRQRGFSRAIYDAIDAALPPCCHDDAFYHFTPCAPPLSATTPPLRRDATLFFFLR